MSTVDPYTPVILRHPRLPLSAHVIPLGLNVTRLLFTDPTNGTTHDAIVGPEDPADHWKRGRTFLGPIIGRYANRVPTGEHAFEGGEVRVAEFSAPGVSLHGGPELIDGTAAHPAAVPDDGRLTLQEGPFDRLVWQRLSSRTSQHFPAESPSTPSGSSAIFGLLSKGAEVTKEGYPGTLRVEVRLAIQSGSGMTPAAEGIPDLGRSTGTLRIEYRASLVDDGSLCVATPLNMTQHWAFNLSASDAKAREQDKGTVDTHTLRMFPAAGNDKLYAVGLDAVNNPTGELHDCHATPHDWLAGGADGHGNAIIRPDGLAEGYDHFYAWGAPTDEAAQAAAAEQGIHPDGGAQLLHATQPKVILHAPNTLLSLAFRTNQTGVQVYTATGQPDAPAPADRSGGAKKRLHAAPGEENDGIAKRSGVALEFAHPHGTFLFPAYQQLARDDTILRKGAQYRNWVEVELFKGGT